MTRLRFAAGYEIIAGLIGLAYAIHPAPLPNGQAVTFNVFAVGLAAASILLGAFTWTGDPVPARISLVFQLLQVIRVKSSVFVFAVLVGVEGTVRFEGPLVSLFTTAGISLMALRPASAQPTVIGVNVVALLVSVMLWGGHRARVRAATVGETAPGELVVGGQAG